MEQNHGQAITAMGYISPSSILWMENIFTAMKEMEQSEFMVVTESSAEEIDMSFGQKICTLNGDIIAKHFGPAFGQASSFCAEGYG
eukprot:6402573-Ditylum_brightwellii.AAC.1